MLTLWNGIDRSLANDMRRMDQLFAERAPRLGYRAAEWPRVNVIDTDDAIEVQAEVPGLGPDDVTVTLHEGELKLEAKHEEHQEHSESAQPGRKVLFRERHALSFSRTFKLNVEIDESQVSAQVKDGLLTVTLPKAAPLQPKQIPIVAK
jgi:HSP20 family protein